MIVKESINFERGLEPKQALNVGKLHLIQQWLDDAGVGIKNFKINDDFSIDLFLPFTMNQQRPDLFPDGKLPEYIEFKSTKDFDVDDCGIVSLERFPLFVIGYFSCQMNKITSLEGFPRKIVRNAYVMGNEKRFTEHDIRQKCNVVGDVEADDSDV
jgi:hypothetical protein